MNRVVLALVVSAFPFVASSAQVSRFHYSAGAGVILLRSTAPEAGYPDPNSISGNDVTSVFRLKTMNTNVLHLFLGAGAELPVWKFTPDHSLGLSLNARAGILGSPEKAEGFNARPIFDFPQYATWRYGARATKKSKSTFGVAVGAGYRFTHFFLPFNSPSVMLEGVYSASKLDWFLRLSADTRKMQYYNEYSSEGLVPVLSLRQANVTIGRSF